MPTSPATAAQELLNQLSVQSISRFSDNFEVVSGLRMGVASQDLRLASVMHFRANPDGPDKLPANLELIATRRDYAPDIGRAPGLDVIVLTTGGPAFHAYSYDNFYDVPLEATGDFAEVLKTAIWHHFDNYSA